MLWLTASLLADRVITQNTKIYILLKTSTAGSATLGDTSWATIILQLESSISWGGHRTYFVNGGEQLGWGHRTTLKERA